MSVPFTADVCAAALVASASAYGDHPIRALECRAGHKKRSLAPAVAAIAAETGQDAGNLCRLIGVRLATFNAAERDAKPTYRQAVRKAEAALKAFRRHAPVSEVIVPKPAPRAVAPPPMASDPAVDHRDAIREALDRRKSKGLTVSVAGVEADKAALSEAGSGGCRAHVHLKAFAGQACHQPAVVGRLFCAEHCRQMGQKDTPVQLTPVIMPRAYSDRAVR